jgi:hypothetical protein
MKHRTEKHTNFPEDPMDRHKFEATPPIPMKDRPL